MDLIWGLIIGFIFGVITGIITLPYITKKRKEEDEQAIQDRFESERLAEEAKELGKHYN